MFPWSRKLRSNSGYCTLCNMTSTKDRCDRCTKMLEYENQRKPLQEAIARLHVRRTAILSEAALPDEPYRIVHVTPGEFDNNDFWLVERAVNAIKGVTQNQDVILNPNPTDSAQPYLVVAANPEYVEKYPETYASIEQLDADDPIVETRWIRIGPKVRLQVVENSRQYVNHSLYGYGHPNSRAYMQEQFEDFSTYEEAETWLKAYIAGPPEPVYFKG